MKLFETQPNRSHQSGFTLIELLVSMSLFIVVLTMAVGSLLVLINSNAKAQNMQAAVSNVQFALDSMAREIRTGYSYYCSNGTETTGGIGTVNNCSSKGTYLSIIEGGQSLSQGLSNKRIAFCYDSGSQAVYRKVGSGSGSCGSGAWLRLTDPSVQITGMHFSVRNTETKTTGSNSLQPNVTIYIEGEVTGLGETDSSFVLQTTVTQRVLDL